MKKIWYLWIDGKKEGPFSFFNLKRDSRITPDTFVWKEGFPKWMRIRDVPELKQVFSDDVPESGGDVEIIKKPCITPQEEIVLDFGKEPPYLFWLIIVLIIVLYMTTQLFWIR